MDSRDLRIVVSIISLIACLAISLATAEAGSFGRLTAFAKHVSTVRTYADPDGASPAGEVMLDDFALPKSILKKSEYDYALVEHDGKKIWVDQGQFKVEGQTVTVVDGSGPDLGRGAVKTTATRGQAEDY